MANGSLPLMQGNYQVEGGAPSGPIPTEDINIKQGFDKLAESLESFSRNVVDLNKAMTKLLGVEKRETGTNKSGNKLLSQIEKNTQDGEGGGGGGDLLGDMQSQFKNKGQQEEDDPSTDILIDIKENIQRNFLKEFKVLQEIADNIGGGMDLDLPGGGRGGGRGGGKDGGKGGGKKGILSRVGSGVANVGRGIGSALGTAARFAGPLAAVGVGAYSAVQGASKAGEFFGKDQADTSFGEKSAAGLGQIASDFTFGMVDPKEAALKINEFFEGVGKAFNEGLENVKTFFTETIPNFFTETLPEFFTEKFEQLKEAFPEVFKVITEDIPNFFTQTIPEKFTEAKDAIITKVTEIKDAIVGTFVKIGTGIKEGIQSMIDFVMGLIEKIKNPGKFIAEKAKEGFESLKEGAKGLLDRFTGGDEKERTTQRGTGGQEAVPGQAIKGGAIIIVGHQLKI